MVKLDNLLAGQPYNVVVKLSIPKRSRSQKEPIGFLAASVTFTDVLVGGKTSVGETLFIEKVGERSADKADDTEVGSAVAVQLAARAQREAMTQAQKGDIRGAQATLRMSESTSRLLGRQDLGDMTKGLISDGYATMDSYASRGSKMSPGIARTLGAQTAGMGGQSVGGVSLDASFANESQKKMAGTFSITKASAVVGGDMPDVASMVTTK